MRTELKRCVIIERRWNRLFLICLPRTAWALRGKTNVIVSPGSVDLGGLVSTTEGLVTGDAVVMALVAVLLHSEQLVVGAKQKKPPHSWVHWSFSAHDIFSHNDIDSAHNTRSVVIFHGGSEQSEPQHTNSWIEMKGATNWATSWNLLSSWFMNRKLVLTKTSDSRSKRRS